MALPRHRCLFISFPWRSPMKQSFLHAKKRVIITCQYSKSLVICVSQICFQKPSYHLSCLKMLPLKWAFPDCQALICPVRAHFSIFRARLFHMSSCWKGRGSLCLLLLVGGVTSRWYLALKHNRNLRVVGSAMVFTQRLYNITVYFQSCDGILIHELNCFFFNFVE